MNKQKSAVKIFSVLLCLLLIVGFCPDFEAVSSAATPTKISSISIADIATPRPGVTPDYNANYDIHCNKTTRFDDGLQLINGIGWKYKKVNTMKMLKNTDTFEEKVQYTVTVIVNAKNGYEFDAADNYNSKVTAYVNGKKANVQIVSGYKAKEVILISYTFSPCEYFTIKTVRIADVKIPKTGEQVSFDAAPAGTGYTVSMISWYDDTAHKTLEQGDVFLANHTYTLEIYVRADDGNRLKTDGDDLPDFTAQINNVAAELIYADTNGGIAAGFKVSYTTGSQISRISVSDIEIPKAGNEADYTCKIDGIGYKLAADGIEWEKQVFPYTTMQSGETYKANTSYRILIRLKADDGYTFDTDIATINGEQAEIYNTSGDTYCELIYYYNVPADITAVDITGLTEPFAGGTADMTAAASFSGYEITDIEWTDTTYGYGNYIYNITSFSEGREYTANITLKTVGNNSFRLDPDYDIPDITAKINNKYAGVYSEGGRDEAIIYFRFKTPVEVVAVTDIAAPVAGKAPDTEAASTKAGYKIANVEWYDSTSTPATKLSATDKFSAGHKYTVNVTLYAINDFIFFVDDGYQEITGTINGKDAVAYGSHEYGTAVIGYEFTVPAAHTHTPSEWKSDKDGHWKECTDSTCKAVTTKKSAHEDKNGDEKCDTCNYPIPKPIPAELILSSGCKYTVSPSAKTVTIPSKTSVSTVKTNILNEKYTVLTNDGKAAESTAIAGTGMKIQILGKDNAVLSEYSIIVSADVNGDGLIQAADARIALRYSVKLDPLDGVYFTAGDSDGDGKILASDARTILRKSVGLD